jgi:AcrR family transcriptional regulator
VFLEAGFEAASMAQIAQRVGGSKATLYGYFPSKESLFVAAVHAASSEHMEQTVAELMSNSPEGVEPRLIRFGVKLVAFLSEERVAKAEPANTLGAITEANSSPASAAAAAVVREVWRDSCSPKSRSSRSLRRAIAWPADRISIGSACSGTHAAEPQP